MVFHKVNRELLNISYTLADFKTELENGRISARYVDTRDVIVYEKRIFWEEQHIWFSNQTLLENVRLKFLATGITVHDDPEDDEKQTLIMKVPSSSG